jgi:hypothetical protein
VLEEGRVARIFSRGSVVLAVTLLLSAYATVLHEVDPETRRALLHWLVAQVTRATVVERLGHSWKYLDSSRRVLIYNVAVQGQTTLVVAPPDDASAAYELVLVFDEHERLQRYSLLKVK